MRAAREQFAQFAVKRCRSKNKRARCEFCADFRDSLILDCDLIMAAWRLGGPTSDCIVLASHGSLHMAVVELKGGSYSLGHTRSQLVACTALVMDTLDELKIKAKLCIHLVVIASRHPYSQRDLLCSVMPRVRGKKMKIHTVRCGARFSQVIARA